MFLQHTREADKIESCIVGSYLYVRIVMKTNVFLSNAHVNSGILLYFVYNK